LRLKRPMSAFVHLNPRFSSQAARASRKSSFSLRSASAVRWRKQQRTAGSTLKFDGAMAGGLVSGWRRGASVKALGWLEQKPEWGGWPRWGGWNRSTRSATKPVPKAGTTCARCRIQPTLPAPCVTTGGSNIASTGLDVPVGGEAQDPPISFRRQSRPHSLDGTEPAASPSRR
jgi:hypothetical protein